MPKTDPSPADDAINFLSVLAGTSDESSKPPPTDSELTQLLPGCMPEPREDKPSAEPGHKYVPSALAVELFDKILKCADDDIVWITQNLNERLKLGLSAKQLPPNPPRGVACTASAGKAGGESGFPVEGFGKIESGTMEFGDKPRQSFSRKSAIEDKPIVQFSSFMYFCPETEDVMLIDVMRIGNLSHRSVVRFTTIDATAKAGVKYVLTAGTLVFEPGENMKDIRIPILKTDRWETTLEFAVQLLDEGVENAMLGFYLHEARVKIIDVDTFPTNKHDEEIKVLVKTGDREQVPKQSLLREYFKMAWGDADVKNATIKMMVVDQLHNLNFLGSLFLSVYLVDFAVNQDEPVDRLWIKGNRDANILFVVLLTLIPFALFHIVDYVRLSWELDACDLQRSLLRKFLNYDENARAQLHEANLIMGMIRDTNAVVADGYNQMIALARACGKLFMILVYQVTSPFVFVDLNIEFDFTFWLSSFGPIILLPIFLITFMSFRRGKNTRVLADRNIKEDGLINCVFQTIMNYRLIADYNRRPQTVKMFQDHLDDHADACTIVDQVITNNVYFQKWLTQLLIAMITLVLGHAVSNGYPVGMFLANISVCASVGESFAEIYDALLSMEKVLPALLQITWLMNLPTDLVQRMKLNRNRREETHERRQQLRMSMEQQGMEEDVPIDKLSIVLKDIQFSYKSKGRDKDFDFQGVLDIKQGSLAALVGHRGEGKTTVLKILGGVILPRPEEKGSGGGQQFYIPSHLRVLHVSSEPIFFHGTLRSNLIYGVPRDDHPDADRERVLRICQMLRVQKEVLAVLYDENQKMDWDDVFSQTQQTLLSMARAFIANAEVLCIHKPTLTFDANTSSSVLRLLRDFVDYKGIGQNPGNWHLRRPRTCIITVSRHETLDIVDQIYHVEPHRISKIPYELVGPDLLE